MHRLKAIAGHVAPSDGAPSRSSGPTRTACSFVRDGETQSAAGAQPDGSGPLVEVDVLVVGGGMAGCSSAMYAARHAPHGSQVLLIEGDTVAHAGASSYGESRMYRQMYSEPYFSNMQKMALDLWKELEQAADVRLLREHGLLFYGEVDTGETVEGSIPSAKQTMEELGVPHEHLQARQLEARWPLNARDCDEGIWEPGAGKVHASAACTAMAEQARRAGALVCENEAVVSLGSGPGSSVQARTSRGRTIQARKVIVAVGAWTNDVIAPLGVQFDLTMWQVVWGHYRVDPTRVRDYPQWYYFGKGDQNNNDGGLYCGFPAETDEPVIKVTADFCPDDSQHRARRMSDFSWTPDPHTCQLIDTFLRARWKGIGECVKMQVSPYCMTPDQYFILDRLPKHPNVIVFAGGSGRAFKFAPLIGKCLADLAQDRTPSFDISPFSASRDAVQYIHPSKKST